MNVYISLLRGVNVGGHKILMTQLKELYESLHLVDVKTYIQSGNVIFQSRDNDGYRLKNILEQEIERVFNFQISIIIMTRDELKKVIENNPFSNEDKNKIYITLLSTSFKEISEIEIKNVKDKNEKYYLGKKVIYLFLPQGYGRTKLNNNFFERKLKVAATTRNLKTIKKLYELAK